MAQRDRYTPHQKEAVQQLIGQMILEWERGTGVYARQSTINQRIRNLASAEVQSKQLLEFAYAQGAPRDARTVLYDENVDAYGWYKNASGTLRIDQREHLSALCERIENDEIKVVVAFLVDRLFRDEFLIGPGLFMKLCKEHNCKVVLYTGMVYDFSLDWCQQQFFMESLAAANQLKINKARLHGNKMYMARKGVYDGRFLTVGYIVDRRQFLPDGTPNPQWKRYVIYEPHARVVRWLFRRFRDLDGNLAVLCHEIEETNDGYIFPPFEADVSKENQKVKIGEHGSGGKRLPPSPRGFRISRTGLISILTNRDYIGEWHSEGNKVQVNNHDRIVTDDLFFFADSKLMHKDEAESAVTHPRRKQGAGAALLDGIMTSPAGHCYVFFNTVRGKQYKAYGVYASNELLGDKRLFTIGADELDGLFMARFVDWLDQTPPPEQLERELKQVAKQPNRRQEARRKQILGQIAEVNKQLAAIEAALNTLTLPALVQKKEADYATLLERKEALEADLSAPEPEHVNTILLRWQDTLRLLRFRPAWQEGPPLKILRDMVKALTTRISLSQISSHWLQLDVYWKNPDWGCERAYIYRRPGTTPDWSGEEIEQLQEHYPMGEKDALLAMFSMHTWEGIGRKASELGVPRATWKSKTVIPEGLTWQDWQFMQEQGIVLSEEELTISKIIYWSPLI